jgi:alkaline phosphatase D
MHKLLTVFVFISIIIFSCKNDNKGKLIIDEKPKDTTAFAQFGFGSCQLQAAELPLLKKADSLKLDFFVYLGDNIYSDTYKLSVLDSNYQILAKNPNFQLLKKSTPLYATWDDHDYGYNDSGRHYPLKKESKELFMKFWEIPTTSGRYRHEGIFGSEYLKFGDKTLQLILLDTRTFRDDLVLNKPPQKGYKNDYIPNQNLDSTFLGKEQWTWLEQELLKKADLRIIASSNQFSHEYNGWESWTNVPYEQQKFVDLIAKTKANGVIFLSGDVHWGEISKMPTDKTYPIFDITSSGITETWPNTEPNKYRIGPVIPQNNIGRIKFFYNQKDPTIEMELIDIKGVVNKQLIRLSEITFH